MATPRYNTLWSLVQTWARDAEVPEPMVLRNFCDWIVVGGVPAESIVSPLGDPVDPLEIYRARRELFPTRVEEWGMPSGHAMRSRALLDTVLFADAGVEAFCQSTGTELPPHLRPQPRWPWRRRERAEHLAPPPCPRATEHAERLEAHRHTEGMLAALRSLLDKLLGKPSRYRYQHDPGTSINFAWWDETWSSYSNSAEASIERYGDEAFAVRLAALRREWSEFRKAALQAQGGMLNPYPDDLEDTDATVSSVEVASLAPATGAYAPAALEAWYVDWVAYCGAAGRVPTVDEEWAEAKDACGPGVPREAMRELRGRLAPPMWRRAGRRPRSDSSDR